MRNEKKLSLDIHLYQGFGGYYVEKNGETFYCGKQGLEYEEYKTLAEIEKEAQKELKAEWKVILELPLRGGTWTRKGKNNWELIESNIGFA